MAVNTVANIAALRSLSLAPAPSPEYVQGYYAGTDGGEGTFWYNSSDTTSADNGGTIIVDAIGRRWYRETEGLPYSVKWFGAKGDGTTNDTTAVQETIAAVAANSAGGVAYFPAGLYIVTAVTITTSFITLLGQGPQASIISTSGTTGNLVTFSGTSDAEITYVGMQSIGIQGSQEATSGADVYLEYVHNMVLFDVVIQYGFYGLQINGCTAVRLQQFHLGNTVGNTIMVGDTLIVLDFFFVDGNIASSGESSIYAINVSGMYGSNVDCILAASNGIVFFPGPGERVQAVYINQVLSDTSGESGWLFGGSGSGIL